VPCRPPPERSGPGTFVVLRALASRRAFVIAKRCGVRCGRSGSSQRDRLGLRGAWRAGCSADVRIVRAYSKSRQRSAGRIEMDAGSGLARNPRCAASGVQGAGCDRTWCPERLTGAAPVAPPRRTPARSLTGAGAGLPETVNNFFREKWQRAAAVGSARQRVAVVLMGKEFCPKNRCSGCARGSKCNAS
jgi:hypothetical protein